MANYYTRKLIVIDNLTGEIIDDKTVKFSVKKEKPREYVKVYVDLISSLMEKLTAGEKDLWIELFKYIIQDTGKINMDAEIKSKIAKDLGISINSLNIFLTRLVKKKIIIRKQRGVYYANPIFFWRGHENTKDSIMKIIIKMEDSKDIANTDFDKQ